MSYFDDQMAAWEENDCHGRIEDYTPQFRVEREPASLQPPAPRDAKPRRGSKPRATNRFAANKEREKV